MNCREFKNLLWQEPSRYSDKGKLPDDMRRHLTECPGCSAEYAEFESMFGLVSKAEIVKDDTYWQDFDSQVWARISASETADLKHDTAPSRGEYLGKSSISMRHLLTSLSIATASVAVIMLAVSNVVHQAPRMSESELMGKGQKYAAHSMAPVQSQQLSNTQSAPINIILKRGLDGSADMDEFSILPKPQVNIVNDSALVTIDEAYLTDEGLKDKNLPVMKALSRDVVLNTAHHDSTKVGQMKGNRAEVAPEDWVITVEQMPKMIKAVPPDYPTFAYKLKKGGDVWVKAFVNAEGYVEHAKIYRDSGTNYGFEEAAIKAAYKNQFEPFQVDGVHTPVWVIYKVRFVAKE